METPHTLYFGDLEAKLRNARRLFGSFGRRLLENPLVVQGVEELRRRDDSLKRQMRALGMGEQCRECGRELHGGCCSAGMADETYALLLLINLLAGVELREWEGDGAECRFLGPDGCGLKFKPFICLNYKCRKMLERQSPEQRLALEQATSALLSQLVALEELVQKELCSP